ncbi:hypothetical protein BT67DRAFT_386270 [Trichocladium antarcticum]|uniref:C2H2-type domain-containing protein n=1 Tax=Trichocladium antarcticum TaxID=1450529 RepID=A0AAN6UGB0_9PEZI|nr:hypothetical protein BT67DRAFT_386270 [Trichocladium antarcticum]
MPPYQGHPSYAQPPLLLLLPSVPPLPSTTGAYADSPPAVEYAETREALPLHRPFRCDICSQCFSRNHDLKRHQRVHVAAKPFRCPRCSKHFSRKDALKVPMDAPARRRRRCLLLC